MVLGILVALDPPLRDLDDYLRGAVRQREEVDMNVLRVPRQLQLDTGSGRTAAPDNVPTFHVNPLKTTSCDFPSVPSVPAVYLCRKAPMRAPE